MQGISERIKGSGIWWIRWTGADGKRHFEKAGTHNAAKTLLNKRQQEVILRKKQPELLRSRAVTFGDLCDDALKHSGAENSEKQTYELGLRIDQLRPVFGARSADSIRKNEVVEWLTEQAEEREWAATTQNRWQATFSLIFRVGMDNEKIERNPAARIRKKNGGRRASQVLVRPRGEAFTRSNRAPLRGVPAPFSALNPHWDAHERAVRIALEPGGLRAPAASFDSDQEWRLAHHSSHCHRLGRTPGVAGRERPAGNGPGLSLGPHRRIPARVARMVLDCARRGEDSGIYLALQPPYLCQ